MSRQAGNAAAADRTGRKRALLVGSALSLRAGKIHLLVKVGNISGTWEFAARMPGLDRVRVAAIAATLAGIAVRRSPGALSVAGWRNVRSADQAVTYKLGDNDIELAYRPDGDG